MPTSRATHLFETDLGPQSVDVRRDKRARRLTLRVDARDSAVVITVPPWTPTAEVEAMVRSRAAWIRARLADMGPTIPFVPGNVVPVQGIDRTMMHEDRLRGRARLEGDTLIVPGNMEHFARRVRDWLKTEAKRVIEPLADVTAERAGLRRGRISMRDTKSRWGSCSYDGSLSFSWRLVMAPPYVLDYVVAHEVGHLQERNHSPRFWAVVEQLTENRAAADAWLSKHGQKLHRYG